MPRDYFSEEGAQAGINKMRKGSEIQSQNASGFQSFMSDIEDSALQGTISETWKASANEHFNNLKTEAENTKTLVGTSEKTKSIMSSLVENISQPK